MTLPAHAVAEVQRLLDEAARRALAEELHVDPALIPLRSRQPEPADGGDDDAINRGADDGPSPQGVTRPAPTASCPGVQTRDPAELTPVEAEALERADELDSGTLVERLAETADDVAYLSGTTGDDLRELAALALSLARRLDADPGGD
jgi:hypothetical protein